MESIEYNSVIRWRGIATAINNRQTACKVDNPWENIPIETMGFDHYYKYHLSENHKEYYRKGWRELKASQSKIDQPIPTFRECYNAHIRKARIVTACSVAVAAIVVTLFDYYKNPYSIR
ncbi:MAG TPA: hypothetical protein VLG44_08835 [Chlamydiales bacterium]|nr:hypothetical protein [Chlamydiales bacterium]